MNRPLAISLSVLGALGVALAVYQFGIRPQWQTGTGPETNIPRKTLDNQSPRDVVALGVLEPAEGIFTVGALVGERLERLDVAEGGQVIAHKPIGQLASRGVRQLQLDAATSQLAEAKARRTAEEEAANARIEIATKALERAKATIDEIEVQTKQRDLAAANLRLAQNDLKRFQALPANLVSTQEIERQQLLVQKCEAEVFAANAALAKLSKTQQFNIDAAEADLKAAQASLKQVQASVPVDSLAAQKELAKKSWEQTEISSPIEGTVLTTFVLPGELISQGPILHIANLNAMICRADVYETDVKHIFAGQTAIIRSKAFPPPYDTQGITGKVESVGQMVASPKLSPVDPFQRADRNVVAVRVKLSDEASKIAAKLVKLQVEVHFNAGKP